MSGKNHGLAVEANRDSKKAKQYAEKSITTDTKPKSAVSQSVKIFGYLMTIFYILAVAGFIALTYSLVI